MIVVPLTVFLIFMIIYAAFGSAKWATLNLVNMAVAPLGGLLALLVTGTHLSVSSGVGFLALFGVSEQIGVIMVEYINQLRDRHCRRPDRRSADEYFPLADVLRVVGTSDGSSAIRGRGEERVRIDASTSHIPDGNSRPRANRFTRALAEWPTGS
jgi:hypothetical protein